MTLFPVEKCTGHVVAYGVDLPRSMPWFTYEAMLMTTTDGRLLVPRDGPMLIVCRTSGNLKRMSLVCLLSEREVWDVANQHVLNISSC